MPTEPEPTPPPPKPLFTPVPSMPVEPRPSRPVLLVKFLLHGLALNLLMFIVVFLWAFLAIGLVICGYYLGLLIAIVILVILYGYVNAWITRAAWFDVETGLIACFFHGLLLYIASLVPAAVMLAAGNLFPWSGSNLEYHYLFLSSPFPNPVAFVLALALNLVLMGFLGRAVASIWRRETPALPPLSESEET